MDTIILQKTCVKCKQDFPATREFFYAHQQSKDRLHFRCKGCFKKDRKPRIVAPEGYKHCPKCSTVKPFDAFDRDSARGDKHASTCKECLKEIRPVRYQQAKANGPSFEAPVEIVCKKCGISKPANRNNYTAHATRRYGMKETCKVCEYRYQKEWANRNRIRVNQRNRMRYPNRAKQYYAQRYKDKKETILARQHAFQKANPGIVREWKERYRRTKRGRAIYIAKEHRRRARKLAAGGTYTLQDIERQFRAQKGKCYYCHKKLTKYHIEHVVPLSRGGSNDPSNLVLACPPCNIKKSNKLPHEWPEGGRLM